jgi:outer membrane protein assembly factor BamB
MRAAVCTFTALYLFLTVCFAKPAWQANLDSKIRFYQTTDFGIVLAGTERSLYAIDGQTGERVWRRETGKINETAVTPVPDTDLILFSRDLGDKSRLEAVDLLSGNRVWQSEKVKGDVLQLAVDPANDLIAVVLVKDPHGNAGQEFKKKPIVHVLQLSTGDELWKRELDGGIEMMPSRFGEDLGEIAYTLDNYRAPLLLDGRLFLFYDGVTSLDARTGKEKEREKFKVNEDGLALTEADPVFDDRNIYISGRGRIRAVDRRTGNVVWKADDLGTAAEMALVGNVLYVRTGGQFTRLDDGEIVSKGPYGVSAIDVKNGETIWRYKGADKGLTNFAFADAGMILIADRDDLISIDTRTGKLREKSEHGVEKAQFILVNERRQAVVGGRSEIAAFSLNSSRAGSEPPALAGGRDSYGATIAGSSGPHPHNAIFPNYEEAASTAPPANAGGSDLYVRLRLNEVWRVRHKAPSRGALRIIAGIALRATALYFRYGGVATSAIGIARGGLNIVSTINSFRWSGLQSRFGSFDLTTLASSAARDYATRSIYSYGSLARLPNAANRFGGIQIITPASLRGRVIGGVIDRATPSRSDVQESIFDRLDPARQIDKLSDYLLRRKRLAELRGNHMYFFTDLPKPFDRKGLVGVNIHTGQDARIILAFAPDARFVTDETVNLLYSADGSRLQAFDVLNR